MTHVDFTKVSIEKTMQEVGGIYQKLGNIIPNKYVNIVALPFGSPYNLNHSNYSSILNGEYNGITYQTKAALRVGWEAEVSPFNQNFNPHFLKRIRAYDNNEKEFDIKMNFKLLETKRYISDGDINTIVVHNADKDKVKDLDKRIITY